MAAERDERRHTPLRHLLHDGLAYAGTYGAALANHLPMALIALDPRSGQFDMASAGHHLPLLRRPDGAIETIGETVAYALSLPNSAVVAEVLVNSRLEPMF